MSDAALRPEQLTYYAFKHSQGDYFTQLGIFRHAWLTCGVKPDLDPPMSVIQRYARFLTADKGAHINPLDPGESMDQIYDVVATEFSNVKQQQEAYGKHWEDDRYETAAHLAAVILHKECKILDLNNKWSNYVGKPNVEKRAMRMAQRVQTGQASFIFYHGRDGNNAGHTAINSMYEDMWAVITETETSMQLVPDLCALVEKHSQLVAFAEAAYPGVQ